jgi:adenylate cyclase
MDRAYARAHALLSWALWWAAYCYWLPDRAAGYRESAAEAEYAASLDANDPWARMGNGLSLSQAAQHERALAELRASLGLNPSFALGRMVLAGRCAGPASAIRLSSRPRAHCA